MRQINNHEVILRFLAMGITDELLYLKNYDDNGWFVALKNALQNLSVEVAIWKTDNDDLTIPCIC